MLTLLRKKICVRGSLQIFPNLHIFPPPSKQSRKHFVFLNSYSDFKGNASLTLIELLFVTKRRKSNISHPIKMLQRVFDVLVVVI